MKLLIKFRNTRFRKSHTVMVLQESYTIKLKPNYCKFKLLIRDAITYTKMLFLYDFSRYHCNAGTYNTSFISICRNCIFVTVFNKCAMQLLVFFETYRRRKLVLLVLIIQSWFFSNRYVF